MARQTPTLARLAELAGISQMSASRAINDRHGVSEQTRDKVLRIAAEIGYVANRTAQKLSGGRTRIVGLLTPVRQDQFVSELIIGSGRAARKAGYEMLVYPVFDEERETHHNVLTLLQQFSDGLVAILPHDDAPYLKALNEADIPVVVVDQRGVFPQYPSVASDNYEGARLAVQHLVELGHTRIAFISGDERLTAAQDRARGFNDAMRQQGLRPEASLTAIGRFSQVMGFKAASHLLKLKRPPTAIFAANDLSAFGAIAAAHELGMRVPDDVSIIGFDDVPMASQVYPPLTTIRQPLQQMGRSAVNILLARIAGIELPSDRITLPTDLILRNSTARPAEKRVAQQR